MELKLFYILSINILNYRFNNESLLRSIKYKMLKINEIGLDKRSYLYGLKKILTKISRFVPKRKAFTMISKNPIICSCLRYQCKNE